MRMQLRNYKEVPPDGLTYTHPETGYHQPFTYDFTQWEAWAREHLVGNGLQVPADLRQRMEDQLCQTLPPGWCEYDDPSRPRASLAIRWSDVETASKVFIDWVSQGRPLVSQTEAERRAKICANCYMNVRATGCGQSCRELIQKVVSLFVQKKTSMDERLDNCAACKCFLRSKVHFRLDILEPNDTDSLQPLLPGFCWLKKGGDNYLPDHGCDR